MPYLSLIATHRAYALGSETSHYSLTTIHCLTTSPVARECVRCAG